MRMLSRNKIKSPEEQKLGEGGDDKQVIKLMWPKFILQIPPLLNDDMTPCKSGSILYNRIDPFFIYSLVL